MNLQSRKFVLTLVFTAVFLANYILKLGIAWPEMLALASMYGLYSFANVLEKPSVKLYGDISEGEEIAEEE